MFPNVRRVINRPLGPGSPGLAGVANGLALAAIVVGGLMFAFGEGAAKRTLAGVIFGVGMAVGAVNFTAWLFP